MSSLSPSATDARRSPSVLSAEELDAFRREGYVRLKQAFPRELALAMQDEIWKELREHHGIDRADRTTWAQPRHSPRRAKHLPLNAELAGPRFQGAISDLIGNDAWRRPATWGGFLVTFPQEPPAHETSPVAVPSDTWHWDGPPAGEGLLVFSFYSDVGPGGGGTMLLAGSHRLIADFYASLSPAELARPHRFHRKRFARWDPWLAALTGRSEPPIPDGPDRVRAFMERTTDVRGVPCRVVELTGEPGDAVFCNLGMLHAAGTNRSRDPRFMRVKFLLLDGRRDEDASPPGTSRGRPDSHE